MRFGISFGALYAPTERIVKLGKEAEHMGFDYLWIPDSQLIYRDPYVNLTLLAKETKHSRLGTLVTTPLTRHVTVIACAMLTLDEVSKGRMIIGLGAGDSSVRRIGLSPSTTQQLSEAIHIIRKLCEGEVVDFSGVKFGLRFGGRRIPIYVVATGHNMLRLGGSLGDGVVIHSGTSSALVDLALKAVMEGANGASRDPKSIDLVHLGFCALSEDRSRAYREVKPSVMWFLVRYLSLLRKAGFNVSTDLIAKVGRFKEYSEEHDLHHSSEWEKAMDAASFLPDSFASDLAYVGTPEDITKKIRELEDKGFKQVIIRPTSTENWEKTFRTFAEHVIPNFR